MSEKSTSLNLLQLSQFAVFYYKKIVGNEYGNLVGEVQKWFNNEVSAVQLYLNSNCFQFWNFAKDLLPNLSILATKIFSFVVQSATCERLFSSFGNLITKQRNCLSSQNAHYLTQVKRNVKIMEENMESNDKKNKKIIIDPTERKKIPLTQDVNEIEFIIDSDSENNSDDDTNGADNEESDEQGGEEETSNITSDFVRILDLFEEPDEELYNDAEEKNTLEDMSNEVIVLKYHDGEQYRTQNPYPQHNNGVCQQEKLKGTRAIKIDLITVFPNNIKLPSLDQLQ